MHNLSGIVDLIELGNVKLSSEQPEESFIVHERYIQYPEEPGAEPYRGWKEYNSREEQVKVASGWPNLRNGYAYIVNEKTGTRRSVYPHEFDKEKREDWQKEGWREEDPSERDIFCYLEFRDLKAYKEYCECLYENEWGQSWFYTEEEKKQYDEEERLKKEREEFASMNAWTKRFAEEHGVHPCSLEFLDKLQEHISLQEAEWEFRMEGAQEDGLCLGFGCSPDEWYDHMDGLREGLYKVDDFSSRVWAFCEKELPLLVAQWREKNQKAAC